MSNSKILDYVMRTPGNTNRTILAQMVDSETSGVLEAAKAYTDSQRLGYEEKDVYIYDESKVFLAARIPEQGEAYVSWISPNIISIEQIIGEEFIAEKNGEIIKSVVKEENIESSEGILAYLDPEISAYPLFQIFPTLAVLERYNIMMDGWIESGKEADKLPGVGLYFTSNDFLLEDGSMDKAKTMSITANIIHKINPKFLPSLNGNYDAIINYSRENGTSSFFEVGDYSSLLSMIENNMMPKVLFRATSEYGLSMLDFMFNSLSVTLYNTSKGVTIRIETICNYHLVTFSIYSDNTISAFWRPIQFPPM